MLDETFTCENLGLIIKEHTEILLVSHYFTNGSGWWVSMGLLQYLKPINSLLDPRGSLAMKVAPRKIAEADVLFQKMCRKKLVWVQSGEFCNKYDYAIPKSIVKYTYQNRATTAAKYIARCTIIEHKYDMCENFSWS